MRTINLADELYDQFRDRWIECEGIKIVTLDDGTCDLQVTTDLELARMVDAQNAVWESPADETTSRDPD